LFHRKGAVYEIDICHPQRSTVINNRNVTKNRIFNFHRIDYNRFSLREDVGAADGVSLSVGSLIYENLAAFSSGAVLTHVIFAASSARRECHLKVSS